MIGNLVVNIIFPYYQPQPVTSSSCYQPQPTKYNQCKQYIQGRITRQACSKNYYDIDKVGKHGNIHSGIPTPDKTNTHYSIGK